MLWVIEALVYLALLTLAGTAAGDPRDVVGEGCGPASAALAVSVAETPDAVRLHIQASEDVEAGSIEIRFAGRKMVVLARDAAGRAIRSRGLRLLEPVMEEGASAVYDAEGALVVTLRKQPPAAAPMSREGMVVPLHGGAENTVGTPSPAPG